MTLGQWQRLSASMSSSLKKNFQRSPQCGCKDTLPSISLEMEQCEVIKKQGNWGQGLGLHCKWQSPCLWGWVAHLWNLALTLRAHSGVRTIREKGGTSESWLWQFQYPCYSDTRHPPMLGSGTQRCPTKSGHTDIQMLIEFNRNYCYLQTWFLLLLCSEFCIYLISAPIQSESNY